MKTTINYKKPITLSLSFFLLMMFAVFSCFISCRSNVNNATPPAGVMAVNSAQASTPQDFYIDNTKQNSSAIAYTQSTGYFYVIGGNHQTQFETSSTTTISASGSFSFAPGAYYSVFYTDAKTANAYQNDRTMPQQADSRVRFINLSTALNSNVDVTSTVGGKTSGLISALAYQAASAYMEVSSASTFSLSASGSSTVLLNIPVVLQAGKIYTIFISGTTSTTITYSLVAEN